MKKLAVMVLVLLLAVPALAFLYEVKILTPDEIKQLSDENLGNVYTDAVIEREASAIFHGKAGFNPREYKSFKDLLGFIVHIREEMVRRQITPAPVDEWLR